MGGLAVWVCAPARAVRPDVTQVVGMLFWTDIKYGVLNTRVN